MREVIAQKLNIFHHISGTKPPKFLNAVEGEGSLYEVRLVSDTKL